MTVELYENHIKKFLNLFEFNKKNYNFIIFQFFVFVFFIHFFFVFINFVFIFIFIFILRNFLKKKHLSLILSKSLKKKRMFQQMS